MGDACDAASLIPRSPNASPDAFLSRKEASSALPISHPVPPFRRTGPCAKLNDFRYRKAHSDVVTSFCATVGRANALKSIKLSIACCSSAARCYFGFCEIIRSPAYPFSERTVLLRRAIFNDGRTIWNLRKFHPPSLILPHLARRLVFRGGFQHCKGLLSASQGEPTAQLRPM